ncbi:TadE/TadG family type IV pilus assembly protein [Novosphingobium tardum]|uniref:TadE/TadG family type IV pilus assembly protein n=1 Tax=Novosphingobium tardum TaxID=1538021 RepID=A0ABV8RQQ8_9SPHN
MTTAQFLRALRKDQAGAAVIEFAILAPAIIAMMLGVFQVGIALQNYNALRNASAEVARYALVQYGTGNMLTDDQLRDYAISVGRGAPYLLNSDRLIAKVTTPATQRVVGAMEKNLEVEYQIPTVFEAMGLRGPYISYSRPMFMVTAAAPAP